MKLTEEKCVRTNYDKPAWETKPPVYGGFHGRRRHLGSGWGEQGKIYSECMGRNRDFDARWLGELWHSTISVNCKLKILAKRGNRSDLRIVLFQRKPQI